MADSNDHAPDRRHTLGAAFLAALAEDFAQHGAGAIVRVREDKALDYLKVVASLLPKDPPREGSVLEGMPDDELRAVLAALQPILAGASATAAGAGEGAPDDEASS